MKLREANETQAQAQMSTSSPMVETENAILHYSQAGLNKQF